MRRRASSYQRGEVVVVPFPFADLSAQKVRPSVVVSGSEYHRDEPDVIVACVTSNVTQNAGSTDTLLDDWKKAGLHVPSVVKSALSTLEPSLIRYRVGKLTARDMSAVAERIARALELALTSHEETAAIQIKT